MSQTLFTSRDYQIQFTGVSLLRESFPWNQSEEAYIYLEVTNHTKEEIDVYCSDLNINDEIFALDEWSGLTVPAGAVKEGGFWFSYEGKDIEELLKNAMLSFRVKICEKAIPGEALKVIYETDVLDAEYHRDRVQKDGEDTEAEQKTTVFDNEDYRIDFTGVSLLSDYFPRNKSEEAYIYLEVTNYTYQEIDVYYSDLSINGEEFEFGEWICLNVPPGSAAEGDFWFSYEGKDIEEILKDARLSFRVRICEKTIPGEDLKVIYETGLLEAEFHRDGENQHG